jgi:hypothetical protein
MFFSYIRKSYRERRIVSQRGAGAWKASWESTTVGSNQFSHFLETFEEKQRQDAVMSCALLPSAVRVIKVGRRGAVPITAILFGHSGGDGARYVTSCTLADVSKKPVASITVNMLREGRAGRSDSISGGSRRLFTTACRSAATGYKYPFEAGTAGLLP